MKQEQDYGIAEQGAYRILVVDDEALETDALRRILTREFPGRVDVATASNGSKAIRMAESLRPDIILMDIEMPGVSGLDAARVIRQMLPRCRIIIITAYQRFQYAQDAVSLGVSDYLLKPLATADLLALLTRTMAEIDRDRQDEGRRALLDQLAMEQFVLSVISGYSSPASLEKQLAELSIPFRYGFFCVIKGADGESAERLSTLVHAQLRERTDRVVLSYIYDTLLLHVTLMGVAYQGETAIRENIV
ncbi:response regulator, partial [Eubacteriales bacterium OttesenSCG-928-A19]|nr:response regulator [Eubacteriales bacterium OttesenSCG-928-A19]